MLAILKSFIKPIIPPPILALKRKINRYLEDRRFSYIYHLHTAHKLLSFQKFHDRNAKIKVLFYNDWGGSWEALEPLALALANDERFEVVVLAMPTLVQSQNFYDLGATKSLQAFADKIRTPITHALDSHARVQCVVGFDTQMYPMIFPSDTQAQYCFTTRPYDGLRPRGWSNADISECMKLCYVEYGILIFSANNNNVAYANEYLRYYDFIFAPTIFHQYVIQKHQKSLNFMQILVVGSSRLETIANTDFSKPLAKKLTVCYMPRWNNCDSHSSFFMYMDLLWTLARQDKITLIWRPHPNMYDHYVKATKLWTQEQWNALVTTPNVYLDTDPNYFDSFKKADVLISDTSSMLVYSFLSGKPTIYTQNILGGELNNWAAKWVYKGCFVMNDQDTLKAFLEQLQEDYHEVVYDLQGRHKEILNESFYFPQEGSVQRIIDTLIADTQNTFKSRGEQK